MRFPVDAKMIQKRSTTPGEVPTVAPSDDHTDGTWDALDIYSGEFFVNEPDEKIFININGTIKELNFGTPTSVVAKYSPVFGSDNKSYLKFKDDIYEMLAEFFFEGTTSGGTPTVAKCRLTNKGATTSNIRIYDITNGNTIAEVTDFDPTTKQVFETVVLTLIPANLPAGEAVFQVQGTSNVTGGGKETWLNTIILE